MPRSKGIKRTSKIAPYVPAVVAPVVEVPDPFENDADQVANIVVPVEASGEPDTNLSADADLTIVP